MSKLDNGFFLSAPYIVEDGTYGELFDVFKAHPQENKEIVHRACELISEYICFNMSICAYYKHKEHEAYSQPFRNIDTFDLTDWKIEVFAENTEEMDMITPQTIGSFTDKHYPNIQKMLSFFSFENELKIKREEPLVEEYNVPYGVLFATLLDGKMLDR